jgi:hypothetical protein
MKKIILTAAVVSLLSGCATQQTTTSMPPLRGDNFANAADFSQFGTFAAQKARSSFLSISTFSVSADRSRASTYVYSKVQQFIVAYAMDTNGYDLKNVIEYANSKALEAAKGVAAPTAFIMLGVSSSNIVDGANIFVSTYSTVMMQKIREHTIAMNSTKPKGKNYCIGTNSKVGDTLKFSNGTTVKVIQILGKSDSCKKPNNPILAVLN